MYFTFLFNYPNGPVPFVRCQQHVNTRHEYVACGYDCSMKTFQVFFPWKTHVLRFSRTPLARSPPQISERRLPYFLLAETATDLFSIASLPITLLFSGHPACLGETSLSFLSTIYKEPVIARLVASVIKYVASGQDLSLSVSHNQHST